jgi:hypothetical protein
MTFLLIDQRKPDFLTALFEAFIGVAVMFALIALIFQGVRKLLTYAFGG